MIKGIILDVDGVIVGEKIGYNSPFPHPDVIARLQDIYKKGIPIILCTGKPHYAVQKIIKDCKLANPHIADGGAIIIDPITNTIIKKHVIDPELAAKVVTACLAAHMYVEIYTPDGYIIQRNQFRVNLTPVHTHILQTSPKLVSDLIAESAKFEVVKIMPIATDTKDIARLKAIFEPFKDTLTLAMGVHPIASPHQFGLITARGVSKKQSAIDATTALGIPLSDYLGIGDSTSDWSFMEHCGATATLENGTEELKKLVQFVGPSVDENGILDILNHYGHIEK